MAVNKPSPAWVEVDAYLEAFETAYGRDGSADLADFLPPPRHPLYLAVLRELICVDLEFSWERGRRKRVEDYQTAFPRIIRDREGLQQIALMEYRLRQQAGEAPSAAEYRRRFGVDTEDWPFAGDDPERWQATRKAPENREREGPHPGGEAPCAVQLPEPDGVPGRFDLEAALLLSEAETRIRGGPAGSKWPTVGSQFLGFRLISELGRGAFSRVYLARQGDLANRLVVLKLATEFFHESQMLAQLQHTNIVPIYSSHRAAPFQAVCMPFFGATTLEHVLEELEKQEKLPTSGAGLLGTLKNRRIAVPEQKATVEAGKGNTPSGVETAAPAIPGRKTTGTLEQLGASSYVRAVLWIGSRLADGLAHAHERGVLHLDLKPANILLSDEGQPMLLDFNVSGSVKDRPGGMVPAGGTPLYMAPEHLDAMLGGPGRVDERSDIYSLGLVFYELLTERRRAPDSDPERPREPVKLKGRRWNQAVSPAVEALIRRCLERDPARRYQTARQLQEDLQRQLDNLPLRHTPEPSLRERAGKWVRRHPRLASVTSISAVAALLVLIVSGLYVARGRQLVRAEAVNTVREFREEKKAGLFLLNLLDRSSEELDEGIARCRRSLATYGVLDNPAWQSAPAVASLPPDDQVQLRSEVAELLLVLARATGLQASRASDPGQRKELIQSALRLNHLAEECFGGQETLRAVWLQRANLTRLSGDQAEAEALAAKAEQIPMRSARDRALVALEHMRKREFHQAVALLEEACRRDRQNSVLWSWLGDCHASLGQNAKAAQCYTGSTALWPTFWRNHHRLGQEYLELKEYKQARAEFDEAIRLRADWWPVYLDRALARSQLGDHRGAIDDLTRALDLRPSHTRIYFMRARMRERAGDRDGARRDREEGLKREPGDELSWIARGVARLPADPKAALEDFEAALRVNPHSRTAAQNKAHVLAERLGHTAEAVAVLDEVVEHHPDYTRARTGRGVLLARLGKRDAALQDAKEALRQDTAAARVYEVACIYALTSKHEPADSGEAFRLLLNALKGGHGFELLPKDTDLDPIRDQPEFRRLVELARALQPPGPAKGEQR